MAVEEQSKGWKEAIRRIEGAKRSPDSDLDLSGLGLTAIPDSLAQLANLQNLDLVRH